DSRHARDTGIERDALRRTKRLARELERQLGISRTSDGPTRTAPGERPGGGDDRIAGLLLAFAYPDRIARRRPGAGHRYMLVNGRGAELTDAQSLAREEYLVAIDVDDRDRDARIRLAAPVSESDIEHYFENDLTHAE